MNPVSRLSSFGFVAIAASVFAQGCSGRTYHLGDAPDGGVEDAGGLPVALGPGGSACSNGCDSPFEETDPSPTLPPPASGSCSTTGAPACDGNATGYVCSDQRKPQKGSSLPLACTSGTNDGFDTDYCCIPWSGTSATCKPLQDFPCDGYAFQCVPGSFPRTIDPNLTCGENFPNSNGNNDFCCVLH